MATDLSNLNADAKDLYWLAVFQFGGSTIGNIYLSDREFALTAYSQSVSVSPVVTEWPDIAAAINLAMEETLAFKTATLTAINSPQDPMQLEYAIESRATIQGSNVFIYLANCVVGTPPTDISDFKLMRRYMVDTYKITTTEISFTLIDWFYQASLREVGRLITTDLFPSAPDDSIGSMIPIVIGQVDDCECLLVDAGASSALTVDIDAEDVSITLDDASEFGASGSAWIDDEEITYSGITGSALTGCVRGTNGTTAAEHSSGAEVREKLAYYRYLACEEEKDISAVVVNGVTLGESQYDVTHADLDERAVTYIDIAEIPYSTATSGVDVEIDSEGLVDWSTADSVGVTDAANAVDEDEDTAHTSLATLESNGVGTAKLSAKITSAAPARNTNLTKATLNVEYQARGVYDGSLNIEWPTANPPKINVYDNAGTLVKESELGKPADSDMESNISVTANTDDTVGYEQTLAYYSGFSTVSYHDGQEYEIIIFNWEAFNGVAAGTDITDVLSGTADSTNTDKTGTWNGLTEPIIGPNAEISTDLVLSVKDTDSTNIDTEDVITKIGVVAKFFGTDSITGKSCPFTAYLVIGGSTYTIGTCNVTSDAEVAISGTAEGTWTRAQVMAATVKLRATHAVVNTADDWDKYFECALLGVTLTAYLGIDITADADGLVASSRITQSLNISAAALEGWSWFDGTGATKPTVEITFPSTTSAAKIDIYSINWTVRESATTSSPPSASEIASCRATIGTAPVCAYDMIETLMSLSADGNIVYCNQDMAEELIDEGGVEEITIGGTWSRAALVAALAAVYGSSYTDSVAGRDAIIATWQAAPPWEYSRRISDTTTVNDLLMSAVTEAGIRVCLRGSAIHFYAGIYQYPLTPRTAVSTITRDEMVRDTLVAKEMSSADDVVNYLTLNYSRSGSTGEFCNVIIAEDTISQELGWGEKYATYDAEWIRDATTAGLLADRLIFNNAFPHQLVTIVGELRLLGVDVSYPTSIFDEESRLSWQTGTCASLAMSDIDKVKAIIAIPGNRIRIYGTDEESYKLNVYVELYPAQCRFEFWAYVPSLSQYAIVATIGWDGIRLRNGIMSIVLDDDEELTGPIEGANVPDGAFARGYFKLAVYDENLSKWIKCATLDGGTLVVNGSSICPGPLTRVTDSESTSPIMDNVGMVDRDWTNDGSTPWTRALVFSADKENPLLAFEPTTVGGHQNATVHTRGIKDMLFKTAIFILALLAVCFSPAAHAASSTDSISFGENGIYDGNVMIWRSGDDLYFKDLTAGTFSLFSIIDLVSSNNLTSEQIIDITDDIFQPLNANLTDLAGLTAATGDLISGGGAGDWQKVAGNITTTKKFLTQTGTGSASALPTWGTLASSDIPDLSATYQPLDSDLTAVAGLATAGMVARTGAGTAAARTLTGTSPISVTNGDGVAGNPTVGVAADLADLAGLTAATGDLIAGGGAGDWQKVAGNITTTKKFLTQTGGGAASALPTWDVIDSSDLHDLDPEFNTSTVTATSTTSIIDPDSYADLKFVAEGDSLSDGSGCGGVAYAWPTRLRVKSGLFGRSTAYNFALAGDRVTSMLLEYVGQAGLETVRPSQLGDEGWFFLWGGSNDIAYGSSAESIYANLKTLWAEARAHRYKVVAFTVLARGTGAAGYSAANEARRVTLNALILSDTSLYDYVVRPGTILPDPTDTTYFTADQIHLTPAGHDLLADVIKKTITRNPFMFTSGSSGSSDSALELRINSSGRNTIIGTTSAESRTGIGTALPRQKLQVAGNVTLSETGGTFNDAYFLYSGVYGTWGPYCYGSTLSKNMVTNRFETMLFAPDSADISFGFHAAGVAPTSVWSFAKRFKMRGDTGATSINGDLSLSTGKLSLRDTGATAGAVFQSGDHSSTVTLTAGNSGTIAVTSDLPTSATTTKGGVVNAADWTTFNAKQAGDTDLTAVAGLSSTGLIARTGSGTAAVRTITAGTGVTVSNGGGVSGNPTIAIGQDVSPEQSPQFYSLTLDDNIDVGGTVNSSNISTGYIVADTVIPTKVRYLPATQTAVASTAISSLSVSCLYVNATTDVTYTATPTIATGAPPAYIFILMNNSAHTLTLQDESALTGSKIIAKDRSSVIIKAYSGRQFIYNGSAGYWVEL